MSHHAFPKPDDIIEVTLNNPLHLHLHSQWLANPYHRLQRSDSIMIPQKNGWRELSICTRMEMVMAHGHWIREARTTLDKAKADWYWRTNKMTQKSSRWRRQREPLWWQQGWWRRDDRWWWLDQITTKIWTWLSGQFEPNNNNNNNNPTPPRILSRSQHLYCS